MNGPVVHFVAVAEFSRKSVFSDFFFPDQGKHAAWINNNNNG